MSASISQLIPELQPFATDLVRAAGAAGLQPRITSTRRSHAEQARLYRRYQQGLQKYPVAPPGTSAHEFGYAFDMVISPMDYLPDVGAYWKQQGGVWGGEFNDPIHFEYPGFQANTITAADPTRQNPTSFVENVSSLFIPGGVGVMNDIVSAMTGLFPWLNESDAVYYFTHPWRGMDWLLPQALLDWRKDNLGF